jgi:transposase
MISQVTRCKEGWLVKSPNRHDSNTVTLNNDKPACTCLDFGVHRKCRHIIAVEEFLKEEIENENNVHKTERKTYSQNWTAYNEAQQQEKTLFMQLLADLCGSIEQPQYAFGRPMLPITDMIFCSVFKVYSTFSGRRFTSDMNMAKEKGYLATVPHYNSIFNFLQKKELTPILKRLIEMSSLPLKRVETDFAVDSSGFSTCRFSRWYDFKYGRETSTRIWIKAHLMCGVKTNIITSVELTEGHESDVKFLFPLVCRTAEQFSIKEISADKAYLSKDNLRLIDELGARAYIPFKSSSTGKRHGDGSKLWNKMFYYFMYNHDEFKQHYHKRSNVESTFSMIKRKFGDSVRSKTLTAQINEILCKILAHNLCVVIQEMHKLGIEPIS